MAGVLIWGVLSVLLSPCHLASIPLMVGFISGQGNMNVKRAFLYAVLFSVGMFIAISFIGCITSLIGRMVGYIGSLGNYIIAAIFIIFGLYLMGIIRFPFVGRVGSPLLRRKGICASIIIGFIFGIALGPCTFAYMAPILGIAFKISESNFLYGWLHLVVFAIGHCLVIVLAGTFTGFVQHILNWNEKSKALISLRRISGALVIVGGIYLLWRA